MFRTASLAALALTLAACEVRAPVQGQLASGAETFTGEAVGGADGAGTLKIRSDKGRTCKGRFVYETQRQGSGTFLCSDGTSGPFTFVSTGTRGTGTGTIGGQPFTFTFG